MRRVHAGAGQGVAGRRGGSQAGRHVDRVADHAVVRPGGAADEPAVAAAHLDADGAAGGGADAGQVQRPGDVVLMGERRPQRDQQAGAVLGRIDREQEALDIAGGGRDGADRWAQLLDPAGEVAHDHRHLPVLGQQQPLSRCQPLGHGGRYEPARDGGRHRGRAASRGGATDPLGAPGAGDDPPGPRRPLGGDRRAQRRPARDRDPPPVPVVADEPAVAAAARAGTGVEAQATPADQHAPVGGHRREHAPAQPGRTVGGRGLAGPLGEHQHHRVACEVRDRRVVVPGQLDQRLEELVQGHRDQLAAGAPGPPRAGLAERREAAHVQHQRGAGGAADPSRGAAGAERRAHMHRQADGQSGVVRHGSGGYGEISLRNRSPSRKPGLAG